MAIRDIVKHGDPRLLAPNAEITAFDDPALAALIQDLKDTCWAAPVVESIAAVLQMNAGKLHPSINIDDLDPEVDLDICRGTAVEHPVQYLMKNSFGFGGINCVSILKRYGGQA